MLPEYFLLIPPTVDQRFSSLQRKSRLLLLRLFLQDSFSDCTPEFRKSIIRFQRFLTTMTRKNGQDILHALGQIDVSTNIRSAILRLRPPQKLLSYAIPKFLTLLPKTQEHFVWNHPLPIEMGSAQRMVYNGNMTEVQHHDGTITSFVYEPPHIFSNAIEFSLFDSNPLAQEEAHPEKEGNSIDLGGHDTKEWYNTIEKAFGYIKIALPTWYNTLPQILQRIVPVGFDEQKHLSASYQNALGLAYMTLHPDAFKIAEAIIHESQHNKLNTLLWLDPIAKNGESEWTTSPIRPDLRPIKGVLLAVHAFLPVAALYLKHKKDHPFLEKRLESVIKSNERALETLNQKMQATKLGEKLLFHMNHLHKAIKESNAHS